MKTHFLHKSITRFRSGFTLLETVIAIGVLAVLLTGFLIVFTPAAQGIRRSISTEQMQRLASTLESEVTTFRAGQTTGASNGFEKAFAWIKDSNTAATTIFVYQYKADPTVAPRSDGTLVPIRDTTGREAGNGYVLQSMARRRDDASLATDLAAIEGPIFFVKTTQLLLNGGTLNKGTVGQIQHIVSGAPAAAATAAAYNEAVIAYTADFYTIPTKTATYLTGPGFATHFAASTRPAFSRNLAALR